jgi:hypothetical protein
MYKMAGYEPRVRKWQISNKIFYRRSSKTKAHVESPERRHGKYIKLDRKMYRKKWTASGEGLVIGSCELLVNFWFNIHMSKDSGRAMAQVVSCRPPTAEARFRSRVNPCGICVPCQFHSTGAPLLEETKKLINFLFIFITGLHNKL